VVLQVTPNLVPRLESNVNRIWLFAVTAVVFTTSVVAAAAIATEPDAYEEQTAGDVELEQLPEVE